MEFDLRGKRALVTGAAQGIGLAIVKRLLSCGAKVVALDVQEEKVRNIAKELPGVEAVVADLSDWNATLQALQGIGRVQLLVNNAGVHLPENIQNLSEEACDRQLNVNLKAAMNVCKHVVNDMKAAGEGGAVVNMSSALAIRPFPDKMAYAASKAGLLQFTRCLALDCAPFGIRVNAISPGMVRTEMSKNEFNTPEKLAMLNMLIPMKEKICEPEDIANAVVFLLCDGIAGKITGVNLPVDAGALLT